MQRGLSICARISDLTNSYLDNISNDSQKLSCASHTFDSDSKKFFTQPLADLFWPEVHTEDADFLVFCKMAQINYTILTFRINFSSFSKERL